MTRKLLKSMMALTLALMLTTVSVISGEGTGKGSASGEDSTINCDLPPQHKISD